MDKDINGDCVNKQMCSDYIATCELYEIVLLNGLPGAVYICWHDPDVNTEWADVQWGFTYLDNCDWLLHYTASQNSFEDWRQAYYKLSSRNNSKYICTSLAVEFDRLRRRVDKRWRSSD